MPISALDKNTINLITTGQIITSVYSVVKELLENSLDANAKNIEVNLIDNGLSSIEVKDDGCGISKEDVPFMGLQSYTSKISHFEDLNALSTYGFRGEALNALCALADVEVLTRTKDDDTATLYRLNRNGNIVMSQIRHGSIGTTVQVKNLFKYIPVRRQIISNSRKANHDVKLIESLIKEFGICKSSVRISYKINNALIFVKPSMNNVKEAVSYVFGKGVMTCMEWIQHESSEVTMQLMIPCKTTKNIAELNKMKQQYIFVNNRPIKHKEIIKKVSDSIKEYFNGRLSCKIKPSFLLYMLIDPKDVDVNLEPNKTTVFFKDNHKFLNTIDACIRNYYGVQLKEVDQEPVCDDGSNPYEDDTFEINNSEEESPICKKRKLDCKTVNKPLQKEDYMDKKKTNQETIMKTGNTNKCDNDEDKECNNKICNSVAHTDMEQNHVKNDLNNLLTTAVTVKLVPPDLSDPDSNDADENQKLITNDNKNLSDDIKHIERNINHIDLQEPKRNTLMETDQDSINKSIQLIGTDQDSINNSIQLIETETISQLPIVDLGEDFDMDVVTNHLDADTNKPNLILEQKETDEGEKKMAIEGEEIMIKPIKEEKGMEKQVKTKQISLDTWSRGHVPGLKGGTDVMTYIPGGSKPSTSFAEEAHDESMMEDSACIGFKKFSKTYRPQIAKADLTSVQIAQKLIDLWKEMSPEERGYYRDIANRELASQKNKKKSTEKQDRNSAMRTIVPWNINVQTVKKSFTQNLQSERCLDNFVIGQLKTDLWLVQNNAQIWILDTTDFKENGNGDSIDAECVEKLLKLRLKQNKDLSIMRPVFDLTEIKELYRKS